MESRDDILLVPPSIRFNKSLRDIQGCEHERETRMWIIDVKLRRMIKHMEYSFSVLIQVVLSYGSIACHSAALLKQTRC